MATRKSDAKKKAARPSNDRPPAGPDEYLRLDNASAQRAVPKAIVAEAEARRVEIHAPGRHPDLSASKSREASDTSVIQLPKGASVGLPGRRGGRLKAAEIQRGIKGDVPAHGLDAFQPAWVDYTPHPKMGTSTRPLLRRLGGGLVEPHYGVFGNDDREVYYPSGYPWICVGKILVWDDFSKPYPAWSGSGVLIGGRVVLTAGHMAPWGSKNWAMQFIPAFYDGTSTLGPGVSSWVSDYWGYDTGEEVSAWDMIVLRLYTPLGDSYGYFGTKNYSSSWEGGNYWTLAGYPGAIANANRPSRQMWWPVLDDDGDGNAKEIEYEADATPGDSGGPVFGFWSGAPYAIATHSGGEKTTFLWWTLEDTNVGAGGGALNSLVAWARSNWP